MDVVDEIKGEFSRRFPGTVISVYATSGGVELTDGEHRAFGPPDKILAAIKATPDGDGKALWKNLGEAKFPRPSY